jgi:hypothetical protein
MGLVLPWETPLSHRQEIVYINACRARGSKDEPGGPYLADIDIDSMCGRLLSWYEGAFHTSLRFALAHEKPSPPFARFSTAKAPAETAEPEDADPELRCRAVVESLQRPNLGHEERRKLILEAEVLPFRGQQAAALAPLLRQFIEEYRESNVPADLVAVGSAIRNCVATATIGDAFEAAASLLKAQGRLPIPIELEVEVEVAKMVVRKLNANPPVERDQYPELALRLEELVDAYVRPRFLAREKYGAVALNAVLGLVLTRSGRDAELVERMRTLDVAWFQQLLARRAARLRTDLVARDSEAKLTDIAQALGRLSELDSPYPTS